MCSDVELSLLPGNVLQNEFNIQKHLPIMFKPKETSLKFD